MSACNFSLPVNDSLESLLEKAKKTVESQGGTFTGDTNAGTFFLSVFGSTIGGSYIVENNQMNILIDEKPFMVPCSMIEGVLKSQLG